MPFNMYTFNKMWGVVTPEQSEAKIEEKRKEVDHETEYSSEWKPGDEPYYPVNDEKNSKLYVEHKKLADAEGKVIFSGHLGEYKYYNMDQLIAAGLECNEKYVSV